MAKVLVSLKIFPLNIEVNREVLKEKVEKILPVFASVYKFEDEPIAFGLVAVIAHILLPEEESGGIEAVEVSIKKIKEISNFQTIMVRRI